MQEQGKNEYIMSNISNYTHFQLLYKHICM